MLIIDVMHCVPAAPVHTYIVEKDPARSPISNSPESINEEFGTHLFAPVLTTELEDIWGTKR